MEPKFMDGALRELTVRDGIALEAFLSEFDDCRDELHGFFFERDLPIEAVAHGLSQHARGEGLPSGWVPSSTWFWSVEGAIAGVINVRHHLTPALEAIGGHIGYCVAHSHRRKGVATQMLKATLSRCPELGMSKVLVTCDAENRGSVRTIEVNGGVLAHEGTSWGDHTLERCSRWYWIALLE
jgi:predicted acetyltransferase